MCGTAIGKDREAIGGRVKTILAPYQVGSKIVLLDVFQTSLS